jgi:hypothetical protein
MCWQLFLASDKELPRIEWDEAVPAFNTSELSDVEERVKIQFLQPYVIYLGSHEGCSCGFFSEYKKQEEDRKELAKYLRKTLDAGATLEIFLCWQGGEVKPQTARKKLTPEDFRETEFPLKENEFATIVSESA